MNVLERLKPPVDWRADLLAPSMDAKLRQAVLAELVRARCAAGGTIDVKVDGGAVTLVGVVGSHVQRREAAFSALRVPGLQGLAIEIEVDPDLLQRPHLPAGKAPSWLAALACGAGLRSPTQPPGWWLDRRAQLERSELERQIANSLKCWALNLRWVPRRAPLHAPGTFQALIGLEAGGADRVAGAEQAAGVPAMIGQATASAQQTGAAAHAAPAAALPLTDQQRACLRQERRGRSEKPYAGPDRRATAGAQWQAPRYAGCKVERLRQPRG